MTHGRFSINICCRKGRRAREGRKERRKERKKEARKGKQRGREGSRDTEMLGGREGKARQNLQRKASEKMGINYIRE